MQKQGVKKRNAQMNEFVDGVMENGSFNSSITFSKFLECFKGGGPMRSVVLHFGRRRRRVQEQKVQI